MYPKNAASPQRIAIGAVVQISDGAVQTSGVSVSVMPQGGAAGASGGTVAYEQGIVHYIPTQAETNYASFILIAYKTGCIPVAATIVTTASGVAGYAGLDWSAINAPTTTVGLSGTTIKTATDVAAQITAGDRDTRQFIESQRGHHTGCGAIFYVQKGGSDANPGTYALPFLTIQAALNACTANAHDVVVVLGKTGNAPSVFSEAITMSKEYTFLRGMGKDTKITTAGAASSTITISANGCEVSGLWVNNTGSGATKGVEMASGSDFGWIHHCTIDGAATGAAVTAGANTTIENNRINDCTTAGVNVAQGAAAGLHISVLSNHIDGCATGVNFAGSDSSESIARYNNISGCTTGVVVASGALKVQVTDNRFSGNTTDWTDAGTDTNLSWNALSTTIAGVIPLVTTTTTATNVTTVNGLAANVITAASMAADASAEIADAVWDEATSGHTTAGSTGKALTDASAAGNPWSALTASNTDAGSFGLALGTTLQTSIGDVPTATENADALLNRDMSAVSDTNARSPLNAMRFLRNKWSVAAGTLTVTKENDSTSAWTAAISTDVAAVPIIGSDPA